jgi:hypothetical protein
MFYIMVDVETDGPIPGDYSMNSFGAVLVNEALDKTFYGKLQPISHKYIPDALAVSGHTREEVMTFEEPPVVMQRFQVYMQRKGPICKKFHVKVHNSLGQLHNLYLSH